MVGRGLGCPPVPGGGPGGVEENPKRGMSREEKKKSRFALEPCRAPPARVLVALVNFGHNSPFSLTLSLSRSSRAIPPIGGGPKSPKIPPNLGDPHPKTRGAPTPDLKGGTPINFRGDPNPTLNWRRGPPPSSPLPTFNEHLPGGGLDPPKSPPGPPRGKGKMGFILIFGGVLMGFCIQNFAVFLLALIISSCSAPIFSIFNFSHFPPIFPIPSPKFLTPGAL